MKSESKAEDLETIMVMKCIEKKSTSIKIEYSLFFSENKMQWTTGIPVCRLFKGKCLNSF